MHVLTYLGILSSGEAHSYLVSLNLSPGQDQTRPCFLSYLEAVEFQYDPTEYHRHQVNDTLPDDSPLFTTLLYIGPDRSYYSDRRSGSKPSVPNDSSLQAVSG